MKIEIFNLFTWAVVGIAVLSSMWLASQVPGSDLRAAKASGKENAEVASRAVPKAARAQTSTAASNPGPGPRLGR